jgi:hypothetical protein
MGTRIISSRAGTVVEHVKIICRARERKQAKNLCERAANIPRHFFLHLHKSSHNNIKKKVLVEVKQKPESREHEKKVI